MGILRIGYRNCVDLGLHRKLPRRQTKLRLLETNLLYCNRVSILSSRLAGSPLPSSATITISSHLHTTGSECSWLFLSASYPDSPPKHTNSTLRLAISIPFGTSTNSIPSVTSGKTDRKAVLRISNEHQAHVRSVLVVHSAIPNSWAAERICLQAFGRQFTEGSILPWKKTVLRLDDCRVIFLNVIRQLVQNDENETPPHSFLPSVCLNQYEGKSLQRLHLYIYHMKLHLPRISNWTLIYVESRGLSFRLLPCCFSMFLARPNPITYFYPHIRHLISLFHIA